VKLPRSHFHYLAGLRMEDKGDLSGEEFFFLKQPRKHEVLKTDCRFLMWLNEI